MSKDRAEADVIQSLVRGLSVITALSGEAGGVTLSEVARKTGMTRATSRRILLTLESVGYVRRDESEFGLTPKVLELGYSYLSALPVWQVCRPAMQQLSETLGESVSAGAFDQGRVVYVARVPAQRKMSVSPHVGSMIPALWTSMGRVLLAAKDPAEAEEFIKERTIRPITEQTVTDPAELLAILDEVRSSGWSFVDGELEPGLRAVAVPIQGGDGQVVAALNVGLFASPVKNESVEGTILPALQATAEEISTTLEHLDVTAETVTMSTY